MFTWTLMTFLWIFVALFFAGAGWTLGSWLMAKILAALTRTP